jgi:hypothetical protein
MIMMGFVLLQSANLQILEEVRTPLVMAVSQTHSDRNPASPIISYTLAGIFV